MITTRVVGIGGIFFKARDPDRLRAWYREDLVPRARNTSSPGKRRS